MPLRLLDTNILLAYVRQGALFTWIETNFSLTITSPTPILSVVSEGELRSLALQFGWGQNRIARVQNLLNLFPVVPLPYSTIIDAYARIDDFSRRTGTPMGKNDVWIAATAHVAGARLLTTDRDFDHLQGVFLDRDWVDPSSV